LAAWLTQACIVLQSALNTPTFTVYVPTGRFPGTAYAHAQLRVCPAVKVLLQIDWPTFAPLLLYSSRSIWIPDAAAVAFTLVVIVDV
jgi:hypothetical protein